MSEIDPTDHALATIASILEHPEPAPSRATEESVADNVALAREDLAQEDFADEDPADENLADEDLADEDLADENRDDEHPVVDEQPLVPDHGDADGYTKVGPGPMVAIRLKWTVHRGDDGQFYVHETIGEQSAPVISGPMTSEAAVHFVDQHEEDARHRFEVLRSEIAGRSSLAEFEHRGES